MKLWVQFNVQCKCCKYKLFLPYIIFLRRDWGGFGYPWLLPWKTVGLLLDQALSYCVSPHHAANDFRSVTDPCSIAVFPLSMCVFNYLLLYRSITLLNSWLSIFLATTSTADWCYLWNNFKSKHSAGVIGVPGYCAATWQNCTISLQLLLVSFARLVRPRDQWRMS